MKKTTLSAIRRELLDAALELEAEAAASRRQSAARRHLRARRGIEIHFESRQLESELDHEFDGHDATLRYIHAIRAPDGPPRYPTTAACSRTG